MGSRVEPNLIERCVATTKGFLQNMSEKSVHQLKPKGGGGAKGWMHFLSDHQYRIVDNLRNPKLSVFYPIVNIE